MFDPTTGNPDGTGRGSHYHRRRKANIIPVPQPLTNIMAYLPAPNRGGANTIFNNYTATGSEIFDVDQPDVRLDYNVSEKADFFARYSLADFTIEAPAAFGAEAGGPAFFNFAGQSLDRNQSLALGVTYTFSPDPGWRVPLRDLPLPHPRGALRSGTDPATQAGLPNLNQGSQATSGMPAFYIAETAALISDMRWE